MKDARSIFQELVNRITLDEPKDEIRSLALIILEKFLGLSRTEIMAAKPVAINEELTTSLTEAVGRINDGEPVQYIVGEAFFCGRKFHVNPSVLIPRPETEELIRVVLSKVSADAQPKRGDKFRILDIGTGSGCIAVTLSLALDSAEVVATDVSPAALHVAQFNAAMHHANVRLIEHDILKGPVPVNNLDVIVSNPPYVTRREAGEMQRNVLDFEPHLALFVPDDDPLLFYKAIVKQSLGSLVPDGLLAVEINEVYGAGVRTLLVDAGFSEVQIDNDVPGKQRVVSGRRKAAAGEKRDS